MFRSPRKLPSSKTPCQGSAETLALLGTFSTAAPAPAPAEARGELSLHDLGYISSESVPGSLVPLSQQRKGLCLCQGLEP